MAKTIKVRVAVVVDETGDWSSIGYRKMPDNDCGIAADGVDGAHLRWFWLEAELPLPAGSETVAATVTEATEPA